MTEAPLPDHVLEPLRELVIRLCGFVYFGDKTEGIIATVQALRADPELARRLLADQEEQ